ncbi:MAG TPA: hypothetical protein P5169_00590 [Kiritimatiellia bacterium]|jgi:hypothetical protein|nr:hypothetical protein [Kiritimatiellia bacterium]
MTLNEFIGRAVAFFDRAEGAANAELAVLKARVAEVEKLLAEREGERDAVVAEGERLKARVAEVEKLLVEREEELAAEKRRVTETLAGLAVPAAGIPAGGRGEGVVSGKDLVEQLLGIKDSSERSAFYRKHREALLAASREERQRLG